MTLRLSQRAIVLFGSYIRCDKALSAHENEVALIGESCLLGGDLLWNKASVSDHGACLKDWGGVA